MARYLICAAETSASPELRKAVKTLHERDSGAEFGLVVPAVHPTYWGTWEETEARELAHERVGAARESLGLEGLTLVRAVVGAQSALDAISDELRDGPGYGYPYDAIIVSTHPRGVSRWLRLDLPHQAEKRFGLPVIHVVAKQRVPAHA